MKKALFTAILITKIFSLDIEHLIKKIENLEKVKEKEPIAKIKYDPFFPDIQKKKTKHFKAKKTLKLEAILNKTAFINGKWRKEREKVEGFEIIKIDKDKVLLKKGKKRVILRLFYPSFLKVKEIVK